MSDDGPIYEGRKATGRFRHQDSFIRRIGSEVIPQSTPPDRARSGLGGGGKERQMQEDYAEPELAHPGGDVENRVRSGMSSGIAKAATLRNIGKETFLSVVKETVDLVALEAASKALQEEIEEQQQAALRASTSSGRRSSHTNGTSTSARSKLSSTGGITIRSPSPQQVSRGRAAVPSEDSATGSAFDAFSPNLRPLSGRRGGRGVGRGELVAGAGKTDGSRANGSSREGGEAEGGVGGFRDTVPEMDDQERSMLLGLLSGAYDQVNELTDELQMSLQKLNETELQLKEVVHSQALSASQLMRRSLSARANGEKDDVEGMDGMNRIDEMEVVEVVQDGESSGHEKGVKKIIDRVLPTDEGVNSTPATVRQLQEEVQRLRQRLTQANAHEEKLRQRVQQANAKEEKQRVDLARNQRLMAAMEAQINEGSASPRAPIPRSTSPHGGSRRTNIIPHSGPSSRNNGSLQRSDSRPAGGGLVVTPGGTRYQDGVTKPLVARVAELEEKLVNSSMNNATAKQDYLTIKLRNSHLERDNDELQHQLAKSEAMNDLLRNEIDRLHGVSPEGEADGSGWRRWLGGLQEPPQLEPPTSPQPVKVNSGDSDSPVVIVRDLDKNQLVYAPSRGGFA